MTVFCVFSSAQFVLRTRQLVLIPLQHYYCHKVSSVEKQADLKLCCSSSLHLQTSLQLSQNSIIQTELLISFLLKLTIISGATED